MAHCFTAYREHGVFEGLVAFPADWKPPGGSSFDPDPLPFPNVTIGDRTDHNLERGRAWTTITFTQGAEPQIETATQVDRLTFFNRMVKENEWRTRRIPKLRPDRSGNEGRVALVHLIGFGTLTGREFRRCKCYIAGRRPGFYLSPGDIETCSDCGLSYTYPDSHPDGGEVVEWKYGYSTTMEYPYNGMQILADGHGQYGEEFLVQLEPGAMVRCQNGYNHKATGWLLAWNGESLCFRESQAWIDVTAAHKGEEI